MERFSIGVPQTKNKVITLANHKGRKIIPWSEQNSNHGYPSGRHETPENLRKPVAIGFGFTSHWSKKWREFFKPITKRSNAKPK